MMESMKVSYDEKILIEAIRELKEKPVNILSMYAYCLIDNSEDHQIVRKHIQDIFA